MVTLAGIEPALIIPVELGILVMVIGVEPTCVQLLFQVLRRDRRYTIMNNSEIINYYKTHTQPETANFFGISESTLRRICIKEGFVKENRKSREVKPCEKCGRLTKNPSFCSRSCAAKQTNKIPKRKRTLVCSSCGESMVARKAKGVYMTKCQECYREERDAIETSTKRELLTNDTQRYRKIRYRARRDLVRLGKTSCDKCGYAKHVEACHRIPIREFPLDAPIYEINSPDNLMALCPNCHWEFDNL